LEDKLKEWKEQWNNGDTKFVPELFELVYELKEENLTLWCQKNGLEKALRIARIVND
jgi:hypothetical protein